MVKRSPTFFFWNTVLKYETLIPILVRAERERNFPLYVEVLEQLVHMFFALDHVNYARWTPIHVRDRKCLPDSIRSEFGEQGPLSPPLPSIKHMHEQENKKIKTTGGAVGLTENPVAFR